MSRAAAADPYFYFFGINVMVMRGFQPIRYRSSPPIIHNTLGKIIKPNEGNDPEQNPKGRSEMRREKVKFSIRNTFQIKFSEGMINFGISSENEWISVL